MPYLSNFGLEFENDIVIFDMIFSNCLNLGSKMPYLCIFVLEFQKTIVIFKINSLKFVLLQNFSEKEKCLHLGPKIPYLGISDQKCLI